MAPVYRLKYFDFMGVAEPIRYLLAYGGIQYDNIIVKDVEWATVQKIVPFGKLPVLEIDNRVLYQSVAISLYLGKHLGLVPKDDFDVAELDAIATTVYDFGTKVYDWYQEDNSEYKGVIERELEEKIVPRYLRDFEDILLKKGGYFGGKQVTWVDIYVVSIVESIQGMLNRDLLQKQYPLLYQLQVNVKNIPAIKNYIKTRPSWKY